MRSRLLALVACLLPGCGPGVHDLGVASAPLLEIEAQVDLTQVQRIKPDAPLLAALVWAGIPRVNPLCVKYGADPRLAGYCPNPYGVALGDFQTAAHMDPARPGHFRLTLPRLPDARVAVGSPQGRLAYGTLLLVEDGDRDGQAFLADPYGTPQVPGEPLADVDRVIAASFYDLQRPQDRLVFREGEQVDASGFYPAPECAPPPPGFSVLRSDGLGSGSCRVADVRQPLKMLPVSQAEGMQLLCRRVYLGGGQQAWAVQPHPDMVPPGRPPDKSFCLAPDVWVELSEGECPTPIFYTLKGCWEDPFCPEPQWNFENPRPEWWPC